MRTLQSVPNIGTPTTSYPNGVIIDQTGETDGTALTELLYGDLIQAIHKIKRLTAITENNLPDNETNGFQLVSALFANALPNWQPPSGNIDFAKVKFVSYNNGVYYHKTTTNTTNNPAIDATNWAVVFYWTGTKIVLADESRIVAVEDVANEALEGITSTYHTMTLESGVTTTIGGVNEGWCYHVKIGKFNQVSFKLRIDANTFEIATFDDPITFNSRVKNSSYTFFLTGKVLRGVGLIDGVNLFPFQVTSTFGKLSVITVPSDSSVIEGLISWVE